MECGDTSKRNEEFRSKWSRGKILQSLLIGDSPVIMDVGAHEGESVKFFKSLCPNARILSLEPDPDCYHKLADVSSALDNCACFNLAASSKSGPQKLYRSSLSHLNSLSPLNATSNDHIRLNRIENTLQKKQFLSEFNETSIVECITLDEFSDRNGVQVLDCLKIDVQGWEGSVLAGAATLLKRTRLVIVEIGLFDFYARKSSFGEIEALLPDSFSLYSLLDVSQNPGNGRTDWVDALYVNSADLG